MMGYRSRRYSPTGLYSSALKPPRERMSSYGVVRWSLQLVSIALLLGGIVATVYALISTSWQTLLISEFDVKHEHGLWKDCWRTLSYDPGSSSSLPLPSSSLHPVPSPAALEAAAPWKCTYKFNQEAVEDHAGHAHGAPRARISQTFDDGQEIQHLNLSKASFAMFSLGSFSASPLPNT